MAKAGTRSSSCGRAPTPSPSRSRASTSVRREGIELTTGFTAAINADLQVGSVAETITVSGQSPVVDLQNTKQQVVVTRDVIDSVPTGRSFQNMGILIPGVTGGQVVGSPVNQDVGGSSGQSFMTLAIHGGRQTDQRIDLDGMSTSAWTRPGFVGDRLHRRQHRGIQHQRRGQLGRHRDRRRAHQPDSARGRQHVQGQLLRQLGVARPCRRRTTTTTCGRAACSTPTSSIRCGTSTRPSAGPIKQDKLWFFATYTYSRTDTLVGDSYLNTRSRRVGLRARSDAAGGRRPVLEGRVDAHHLAGDASATRSRRTCRTTTRCHCHFLVGRRERRHPGQLRTRRCSCTFPTRCSRAPGRRRSPTACSPRSACSYILEDQQFNPRPESVAPQITDADQERHLSRHAPRRCAPTRRSTARAARSRT